MRNPSQLWVISFVVTWASFMVLPVIKWRGNYRVDHPGAFWLVPIGILNGIVLTHGGSDVGMSIFNFSVTVILILKTKRRLSQK